MAEVHDLRPCEEELTDVAEIFFRQCHPSFVIDGQPSSQFLGNFPRDEGMLSGTRSNKVNATESYLDSIGTGMLSAGTWGVDVIDIHNAGSRAIDDTGCPQTDPPRPRGHSYIDFRGFSRAERRNAVSMLLILFNARGQLAALGSWGDGVASVVPSFPNE